MSNYPATNPPPTPGADVAARQGDTTPARPRPQPRPAATPESSQPQREAPRRTTRQLALPEPPPPGQVVAAAGSAIVAAAKIGRILGRSGWRIARQLPVVVAVEREAQRLRNTAGSRFATPSPEEERVMLLVQDAGT